MVSGGGCSWTPHEEITEDSQTGSSILAMCFDANTGKELWRSKIGGSRKTDLSSLFSDNTAASPVTDGKRVVFVNVGGTVKCFDYEGVELWSHVWTPFGRHHARAHEPILHDGKVILMHAPRYDLPVSATTKSGSHPLGRGKEYWTFLRAYDLETGKLAWQAEAGTSVHSTSILGKLPDGRHAILTGRGGGHKPPEEPYGLSLIDASNGKSLWDREIHGYAAAQNANWAGQAAHFFIGSEHRSVKIKSGEPLGGVSMTDGVTVTRRKGEGTKPLKKEAPAAEETDHLFHEPDRGEVSLFPFLRRLFHRSGEFGKRSGRVFAGSRSGHSQSGPEGRGSLGQEFTQRHEECLWIQGDSGQAPMRATVGARFFAPPVVVGDLIYFPTMVGMVYALKWNAPVLNEEALVSWSDLGPAGKLGLCRAWHMRMGVCMPARSRN